MTKNNKTSQVPIILFDATSIPRNRGGVGRVIESTLPFLAQRKDFELHIVCKEEHAVEFQKISSHVHLAPARVSRTGMRLLWEQTHLPRLAQKMNAALVFSPHYTYPIIGKFSRVVMIHDLTFFSLPHLHSPLKRLFFRSWIKRIGRNSQLGVVTPSAATAQEFFSIAPMAPARTTVALLGYDRSLFFPPTRAQVTTFSQSVDAPAGGWIAFLGTLEPRKNVPALIQAFSSLPSEVRDNKALLLSGGDGWDDKVDTCLAEARNKGADIRKLGYLPTEQLKALLGGAELVVYPSLGEGFGLPVLEAMACGAPVLTTQELSLPEVGGDVAFYSGTDASSISESMFKLLTNPTVLARAKKQGPLRASTFTWEATADKIASAIQLVLSRSQS